MEKKSKKEWVKVYLNAIRREATDIINRNNIDVAHGWVNKDRAEIENHIAEHIVKCIDSQIDFLKHIKLD